MLGAVPTWLDQNVTLLVLILLLIVAIGVLKYVRLATTRLVLMCLIIIGSGFVLAASNDLEECGSTCSCDLAGVDVSVPICSYP